MFLEGFLRPVEQLSKIITFLALIEFIDITCTSTGSDVISMSLNLTDHWIGNEEVLKEISLSWKQVGEDDSVAQVNVYKVLFHSSTNLFIEIYHEYFAH